MPVCSNCGHDCIDHSIPVQDFWGARCGVVGCMCKLEIPKEFDFLWDQLKKFDRSTYVQLSLKEQDALPIGHPIP